MLFEKGNRHHAKHGAQRKRGIISVPVRNHLIKPLGRFFAQAEIAA